jgi:hypothetical protein
MGSGGYISRLADDRIGELLAELPAVMLTGPRAAGKTTTARRHAGGVLRLDDPALAAVVAADPDAALRRATEPVLIDEWQEVPQILGAVKRTVDDDPRPGRFLLTGSVEADLTAGMWPGTGRVVRVVMHGLTRREIVGAVTGPGLMDIAVGGALDGIRTPTQRLSIDDYVQLAASSGFPEPALRLSHRARLAAARIARATSCGMRTSSAASWTRSSPRNFAPRSNSCNPVPGCITCAPRPAARRSTCSSTWAEAASSQSKSRREARRLRETPAI